MRILIDLHLHTVFSGDSSIQPETIVEQLHSHPFVKGVAITDHDSLRGYFRTCKLAEPFEDIIILPGVEVSTEVGDLIILGVDEETVFPKSLASLLEFSEVYGGTIVIPHPYRSLGLHSVAEEIHAHAIEVLNPTATPKENKLARDLAKRRNLPGIAGTDAHSPNEMWGVYTEVEAELSVDSVLTSIRKGFIRSIRGTRIHPNYGR
jgi:predicted metal-dependent phosphoesterase TrpH